MTSSRVSEIPDSPSVADETTGHAMRVYRFGVVGDLPGCAIQELHRAHQLANRLVEIEKEYATRVTEVWSAFPEVAVTDLAVEQAEALVAEVAAEATEQRKRTGRKQVTGDLRVRVKEARSQLREAKQRRRDVKSTSYAAAKPAFETARDTYRVMVKACYPKAIGDGLFWANYNEVLDRHKRAVKVVQSRRAAGQVADLRFRRWTGEGTLAVQLQRLSDGPPRTPQALADAEKGKWRNVLSLTPVFDPDEWAALTGSKTRVKLDGIRRRKVRFRIGSGDQADWVELPLIVHREIPVDADVTMARISRRMVAGKPRVSVSLVCRFPVTPARTSGPLVAAHLGWRVLPDGALRVAVVKGAGPVPSGLVGHVREHDGWCEVVIPKRTRDLQARIEHVRSQRDRSLNSMRRLLVEWMGAHPGVDLGVTAGEVARWRSPGRFAALAIQLRDEPHRAASMLEAWRKQDKHLWCWEANERDQMIESRNDTWRCVAKWIADSAGLVRVDEWSIASISRVPAVEDTDDPQAAASRANRVLAAPGMLRAQIEETCARDGVQVEKPSGRTLGAHYLCGTTFDPVERASQIMVWCPTCHTMVDQDVNAATLLAG